ncbi:MAG: WYL domain-containing protein [Salinivirgaceae bacterium]|nr:WYL domain-containing protein [Salinivirgaceae bacterium]
MKTDTFRKLIWLIDTIQSAGKISLNDINAKWRNATCNDEKTDSIPRRTFLRYKETILEMFDLEIVFSKADGNTYSISDESFGMGKKTRNWILNSFSVQNLLQESQGLKNRILLEDIPSGARFLTPLLEAMKQSRVVSIDYQKFADTEPTSRRIEPYALKLDKQRWYILARKLPDNELRTYALDRITKIEVLDELFVIDADFNAADCFKDVVGVFIEPEVKAQKVIIRAKSNIANYLRTLPLHPSQIETERTNDYSVFSFTVKPDVEFESCLMRYGSSVEILKPEDFRNKFAKSAQEMFKLYGCGQP